MKTLCTLLLLSGLSASQISAQQKAPSPVDQVMAAQAQLKQRLLEAKKEQGTSPKDQVKGTKTKEKDPETYRKEELKKIKFDRSPSGILKARSEQVSRSKTIAGVNNQKVTQHTPNSIEQYKQEIEAFRNNVILGNWKEVTSYLNKLPKDLGKTTYQRLVSELTMPVSIKPRAELVMMGAKPHTQKNYLSIDDILALMDASPSEIDTSTIEKMAKLIPAVPPQSFFDQLVVGNRHFGKTTFESKLRTAILLINANQIEAAGEFIPDITESRKAEKYQALNILSRYHSEAHKKKLGNSHLPLAWELSTEVMSNQKAPMKERGEALYRALSLVKELEEGSGQDWLLKTFAEPTGEGMQILATVGTLASQSRDIKSSNIRLQQIQLQQKAAEALLATDGIDLSQWKDIFTIYALNWLHEANFSEIYDRSQNARPQMQRDRYGNTFYGSRQVTQQTNRNLPTPIPTGDLLEIIPSDKWIASVDKTTQLQLLEKIPKLFLKVKEHESALPYIQKITTSKPKIAESLVRNLVTVWANNNNPNPNQNSRYRNSYYYSYGYNSRAESIPLTRSKQERNLVKLSELIQTIKAFDLDANFNKEFTDAFITIHSKAEVWRLESLEKVFGDLAALDEKTTASLISRMRVNLAALWPNPKLQQQYKTKRKDKELNLQIIEGYSIARNLTAQALANTPNSWKLLSQLASLKYEESNYLSGIKPQTSHSTTKRESLDDYAKSAQIYANTLPLENETDESAEAYLTWFYAALGSPLLDTLKSYHMPVKSEFNKIKTALDSLPNKIRERHHKAFARTLNTRLANVSPDLKFRYLEAAMSITGTHEEIKSATEVFSYYKDLVTEIELLAQIDGSDKVGREPFGAFINLHHTKEIERESGGFQRYLQNQNNTTYSYNFGRPTEDYRDKFEKAARIALEENFEVISVTFHTDKIESRTSTRKGWRITPYAYFLLQAKGPQIDTLPPLKIDLDFLDTSGYVVLPISSAALPLVSSSENEARPNRNLKITMTLDERNVEEKNEWQLEVKMTSEGLVPALDNLLNLPPKNFEIVKIEDRELQIEELTTTSQDGAPLTTHEHLITLKPKDSSVSSFHFPQLTTLATDSLAKEDPILRQRYQDVDLLTVGEVVDLEYKASSSVWIWSIVLGLLALIITLYLWAKKQGKPESVVSTTVALPEDLTPVSLLHWMKKLLPHISEEKKGELTNEINQLESQFFSKDTTTQDLSEIASRWNKQCNPT